MNMFAIFDIALGKYAQPFAAGSKNVALRMFTDEVNRPADDNNLYKHPQDFELVELAFYDEDQGAFINAQPGERLRVRGSDVAKHFVTAKEAN